MREKFGDVTKHIINEHAWGGAKSGLADGSLRKCKRPHLRKRRARKRVRCPAGRPASGGEGPESVCNPPGKWIDLAFRTNQRSELVPPAGTRSQKTIGIVELIYFGAGPAPRLAGGARQLQLRDRQ